jgi:hypothetical protein
MHPGFGTTVAVVARAPRCEGRETVSPGAPAEDEENLVTERRLEANGVPVQRVDEMDWSDVREPGCYLHLSTGLLARVRAADAATMCQGDGYGGQVARLSANPEAPIALLRAVAARSSYRVKF